MGDTTLATFRIDKETWESFKKWSGDRGSNASTELNQFILRSLGRIDSNLDNSIDSLDTRIDKNIDKRIDSYLDNNLDNRIEDAVKKYLDKHLYDCIDQALLTHLDTCIDNGIDNLDNRIDKKPSEDTLEGASSETQVSEPIEEKKLLTDDLSSDNPTEEMRGTTESQTQQEIGLKGKELGEKIGAAQQLITQWKKRRYDQEKLFPPKNNEKKWKAFMQYELREDGLWYQVKK